MNQNIHSTQFASPEAELALSHQPRRRLPFGLYIGWLVFLLWLGIVTVRYVSIAGLGEFGATYEPAYRILHGQTQYRDFIYTHPPFVHYSLAGLFRLLGTDVWVCNLHLYASWLLSLAVAFLLARSLHLDKYTTLLALAAGAILSFPANLNGHAYSYVGVATCTLVALLLQHGCLWPSRRMFFFVLAGTLCGFSVFIKQNNGVLMAPCAILAIMLADYLRATNPWRIGLHVALFSTAWLIGFLIPFIFFAAQAGPSEVYLQLIADGAQGKAGKYGLFVRMLPKIELGSLNNLPEWTSSRRTLEILSSFGSYLVLLGIYRLVLKSSPYSPRIRLVSVLFLGIGLFIIMLLCGTSYLVSDGKLRDFRDTWPIARGIIPFPWLVFELLIGLSRILLFIIAADFLLATLRGNLGDPGLAVIPILALGVILSTIVSSQIYIAYAGGVASVYAGYFLARRTSWQNAQVFLSMAGSITAVIATGVFFFPLLASPLYELPISSSFRHMWARAPYASRVHDMLGKIGPLIEGERTLWIMTRVDPYSAYGGIPVFSVPVFYSDGFASRSVPSLLAAWEKDPPKIIVYRQPHVGHLLTFQPGIEFDRWINDHYDYMTTVELAAVEVFRIKAIK